MHCDPPFRSTLVALALFLVVGLGVPPSAEAQRPEDPGQLKFRGAAFPVAEEAGEVTVVVKRQRGSTGAVEVSWETTPGTATEGEDYEPISGILSWEDGDRSDKSFVVTILDDEADEGQETFGVVLFDPTGGAELSSPSSAVVRIKPSDRVDDEEEDEGEDEPEPGTLRLTSIAFPAFESSLLAEVSVERIDGTAGEVGVSYQTMDGSAIAGVDYVAAAGMLSWAAGEGGVKTFQVDLVDDDVEEELETISVILSAPTGGASIGSQDVASITIIDDDGGEGDCVADAETLCLLDGRLEIVGTWTDFASNTSAIQWQPTSDESGLGWFYDPNNVEVLLKVVEGCPVNGSLWLFFAATTNLGYEIEVTDLTDGTSNTYSNTLGEVALPLADVTAFACSP